VLDGAGDPGAAAGLGALHLAPSGLQGAVVLRPPADPDFGDLLAPLYRQEADIERRKCVDLGDGGLDDVLVQFPEGPVAAGRDAEQVPEVIEAVGLDGFFREVDELGEFS
jgi:hypothetical protein